jgi:lactoylglutathione lyase
MIRITNPEKSLHFYTEGLGFKIVRKNDYPQDRFSLFFLRAPGDSPAGPLIELTHNWDTNHYDRGDAFGHIAFEVSSIQEIQKQLQKNGYDLSWGPGAAPNGKTVIAFVDDPDGYEIELCEHSLL